MLKKTILCIAIAVVMFAMCSVTAYAVPVKPDRIDDDWYPPETEVQQEVVEHCIVVDNSGMLWYMPEEIPLFFLSEEELADVLTYIKPEETGEALSDFRNYEEITFDAWYYYLNNVNGVAGLLGNMYAESGINPTNLQGSYERALGMSDTAYTAAVDSGTYGNFIGDSAGYGLVQWTYSGYKRDILNYAQSNGYSIGNIYMQNKFLFKQFHTKNLLGVLDTLYNAKSVREASDAVLLRFERPRDQSENAQIRRSNFGQMILDRNVHRCELVDEIREYISSLVEFGKLREESMRAMRNLRMRLRENAFWYRHLGMLGYIYYEAY